MKNSILKSSLIWSSLMTLLTEVTFYLFNIEKFNAEIVAQPHIYFGVLALKFLVFFILCFGVLKFIKKPAFNS